jgi:carbonic anhydrase
MDEVWPLSRRDFIRATRFGIVAAGLGPAIIIPGRLSAAGPAKGAGISSDQALQKLLDGNKRYVAGKATRPNQTVTRRNAVAKGQQPFASILSCSDSRVPPEIVFDQGVGALFVVRVAGNSAADAGLGSLEYAVAVLRTPLLMVLGHERCGAVEAALKGGEVPGQIRVVVDAIKPAVEAVKGQSGDLLDGAVRANAALVVDNLKNTKPILADAVEKKMLKVVGGRYDLDTGIVEMVA